MNKEERAKTLTNPSLYPLIVIENFKCTVCGKHFKSSHGLIRHINIIRKYNEILEGQKNIPEFLINKFKEDIVYLIHQRLGKNSRNTGLQSISIACPVSLYKVIFKIIFIIIQRKQELSSVSFAVQLDIKNWLVYLIIKIGVLNATHKINKHTSNWDHYVANFEKVHYSSFTSNWH